MNNSVHLSRTKRLASSRAGLISIVVASTAAATAAWVQARARRAERDNPPAGQFLYVDGVRVHYVMQGEGPPLVLLHGNAVTNADFKASGLMDRLAKRHRVIAFDRPGFGHSTRPRDRFWTPSAQAALLGAALKRLGIEQPIVVGHSMGAMVALAMALDQPASVARLVLICGYYYPSVRADVLLTAPVALPVLGDALRYTVTALSARATIGRMAENMFAPNEVPPRFFPVLSREMLLRPVQLRADAEDAAFMVPAALSMARRYAGMQVPATLIAGTDDRIVNLKANSARLHSELPYSELITVPKAGHMAHYFAQDQIVRALEGTTRTLAPEVYAAEAVTGAPRQMQPQITRP
jgi:pimeloyl-ACP methyl ester carboxylesterase